MVVTRSPASSLRRMCGSGALLAARGSRGTCARDFRLQNQQLVAAWQVVFLPDDLTSCPVWLNRWGDLLHKLQMAMVLASGPFVVMVTCAPFGELVGRPLHELQLAIGLASGPFHWSWRPVGATAGVTHGIAKCRDIKSSRVQCASLIYQLFTSLCTWLFVSTPKTRMDTRSAMTFSFGASDCGGDFLGRFCGLYNQ